MTKYQPLTDWLAALAATDRGTVDMDFADVAELVGGLPPSAFQYREWWANSGHSHAAAWRSAGWQVDMVDLGRERVRFSRGQIGGGRQAAQPMAAPPSEPDGPELDLRIRLQWHTAGVVTLSGDGRPWFPGAPALPGLYRMTLTGRPGQGRPEVYVGETDDLHRRWGHYRNPGPTQQTNLRLNALLREHLVLGGRVGLAVVTSVTVHHEDGPAELPLARRSARVLAEHAAITALYLSDDVVLLNRDRT
ncbi:MAG TPA: hypothetical protein VJX10_15400 [Pseudonocardiaceae bacterium]|nr:hypothetical protein [Pseudonocardiaceae bacterium]